MQDMLEVANLRETKSKVLESAELTVKDNVISFAGTAMQISNVTQVWKGSLPKKSFPAYPVVVGALLGLGALIFGMSGGGGIVGLLGLAILGFVAYAIWKHKSQMQYYAVHIELNSGRQVSFTSPQLNFIDEAFAVLSNIICEGNKGNKRYNINFGSGIIIDQMNDSSNIKVG